MNELSTAEKTLENSLHNNVALFVLSLLVAIGSGVLFILPAGIPRPLLFICLIASGVLSVAPGWTALGLKRDLKEGLVTEKCYVRSSITVRAEALTVKSPHGTLGLANWTGIPGNHLERKWVMLTYARHSSVAIKAEVLEGEQ